MTVVTHILFYGYLVMVLGLGAGGILVAQWELTHVFDVPLDQMDASARATLLNHYRFLRSVEVGFGTFMLLGRREIFLPTTYSRIFIIGAFANGGSRVLSMVMDGVPHWAFVTFAVLELTAAVLVWICARKAGERL